jgi:Na+/H+ antiporter NhaA
MSTPESSPKQDIQASTQIVDLQSIRNRAIQLITNVAAILGAIIFFVSAYSAVTNQNWVLFGGYAIAFAGLVVISVVRRIPVRLRAFILTGVIYLIGVLEFSQTGLQGNGLIFLLGMVVLTTLLIRARPG